MSDIPDLTESGRWSVPWTADERRGAGAVGLYGADIELSLTPRAVECPAGCSRAGVCNPVVVKTTEGRRVAPFFYEELGPFGTGIDELDNGDDATVTPLLMPAGYESLRSGGFPDGGARG